MQKEIDTLTFLNANPELLLILAVAVVFFANLIPPISYFFELFYVMIHEMGHSVATLFSHGILKGFRVFSNSTGVTNFDKVTSKDLFWMMPAGYLGVPIFTAFMIWFGSLASISVYLLGFMGIVILLFVLTYGRQTPHEKNPDVSTVTLAVGVIYSVAFIGIAWLAHPVISTFALNVLAVQGIFESAHSFKDLAAQVQNGQKGNDPTKMTASFGKIPLLKNAMFWVRAWSLASILILGGTFYFTWLRDVFPLGVG